MDYRELFPGGEIEVTNTELQLMPESTRDGLFQLIKGLAGPFGECIVSGVSAAIVGGNLVVSSGYIWKDNELIKVDNQVVPVTFPSGYWYFVRQETTDNPAYERNYRDGTTHNVANFVRAVAVNVEDQDPAGFDIFDEDLLIDLVNPGADWNESNQFDLSFIRNKPRVMNVLRFGSINIGSVGAGAVGTVYPGSVVGDITQGVKIADASGPQELVEVQFPDHGAGDQYQVITEIIGNSGPPGWTNDNDCTFSIIAKTSTSFAIAIQASGGTDSISLSFRVTNII